VLLGGPIVVDAIRGLLRGHTNVDELVALALVASCAGGYVLEADVVAILMVLGSLFEQRASLRARRAIEQLLRLAPSEATLLHADDREEVVAADRLRAGDRILVRTAQRVAADGVVETGGGNFDTAAVTGESVPRYLRPGETALAGTLALDGSVVLRVTRTGEDSTVGRIIRIVRDAEHYQAPAMRIADRWARYYTPLILCLAAGAWIVSALLGHEQTWQRAVAVLIVGCPCALVLATPTAIIAAMGRAAKLGILIKSGAVLERAADVDALVFDKTGTLTSGKHEVVSVVPANDLKALHEIRGLCPAVHHSVLRLRSGDDATATLAGPPLAAPPMQPVGDVNDPRSAAPRAADPRHRLLALAAAVEYHSTHPFARAIRAHATAAGVAFAPAKDVREIPGVGVTGRVDGQPVVVGRPEFVAHSVRNACAVPGTLLRPIQRYSVIAVDMAGRYAGLLLLQDTLRPAAEGVVDELRETGLRNLTVLSGDHAGAVKLVADRLRLDAAHAGLLPADKAERVSALRAQGHVVAFVGDGMNDAPALAVADVGIAMGGSGTDLALETADVVLLNDRIELLATLFALARRVRTTIKVNLALGLALNVAALVLASTGVLSPMLGALVHNLGSAFVVGNSARFATFGRRPTREVVRAVDAPAQAGVRRAA
jgi:Cd2+/Zn2+-exporting ATPase